MSDVVRTRMYVTDISQWREVGEVHAEVFGDICRWPPWSRCPR